MEAVATVAAGDNGGGESGGSGRGGAGISRCLAAMAFNQRWRRGAARACAPIAVIAVIVVVDGGSGGGGGGGDVVGRRLSTGFG